MVAGQDADTLHIHTLSGVLFGADARPWRDQIAGKQELWETAGAHHVVVRAGALCRSLSNDTALETEPALFKEEQRISRVLQYLPGISAELETKDVRFAMIKSLDHWPDFGSDIDLFTDAPESKVTAVMRSRFDAEIVAPTIGDRLAAKVNYRIPGLQELVEVHFGRLGQTGEHVELARRVLDRSRMEEYGGVSAPVPAPEERLLLATLQRMYRHFYLRLCDIANTQRIVEAGNVDFDELRHASKRAGIWPGVATYLHLSSQYVQHYRGYGLPLPQRVTRAARFGLKKIYPHAGFLRLPLFPQAASLYTRQLAKSLRRNPAAGLRLSLLPPLAAAAGTKYKFTGNDKGVW